MAAINKNTRRATSLRFCLNLHTRFTMRISSKVESEINFHVCSSGRDFIIFTFYLISGIKRTAFWRCLVKLKMESILFWVKNGFKEYRYKIRNVIIRLVFMNKFKIHSRLESLILNRLKKNTSLPHKEKALFSSLFLCVEE